MPRENLLPQIVLGKTRGSPPRSASRESEGHSVSCHTTDTWVLVTVVQDKLDTFSKNAGSAGELSCLTDVHSSAKRAWRLCLHIVCSLAAQFSVKLCSTCRNAGHLENVLFKSIMKDYLDHCQLEWGCAPSTSQLKH